MYIDSTPVIVIADQELQNPETSEERVRELFQKWWDKRTGGACQEDDCFVLPVKVIDYIGVAGTRTPRYGELHFPKNKLSQEQIDLLEKCADIKKCDSLADEYILWGAGRAAAIALVPLPLADVGPLMANEAYMIYRVAEAYGYKIDKSVVAMLAGVAGGSIAGKVVASFLPFLKMPIAAGITYGVGKTAKAYFASGMTLGQDALANVFKNARKEADTIDWNKHRVEEHNDETNE